MIEIYLCQIPKLLPLSEEELQKYSAHHRSSTRQKRHESIISHLCLDLVYQHKFGTPPPLIAYSPSGKPYFTDSVVSFNISHSGELVALAISDSPTPLGIDVQLEVDRTRADKLLNRYGKYINPLPLKVCEHKKDAPKFFRASITGQSSGSPTLSPSPLDIASMDATDTQSITQNTEKSLPLVGIAEDNVNDRLQIYKTPIKELSEFLPLWTSAEAVLKAEGSGLGGLCLLGDVIRDYALWCFVICLDGNRYSLSLAEKL